MEFFYSVKANYLGKICEVIHEEGYGAEVVSQLEYENVKRIGFSPADIQAGGPYLPDNFLRVLILDHVKEIVVYDFNTLNQLSKLTKSLKSEQKIGLFFAPSRYGRRLGFNANLLEIQKIATFLHDNPSLILNTIACHYGTQIFDLSTFTDVTSYLLDIVELFHQNDIQIKVINLGGGFPEAINVHRNKIQEIALKIQDLIHQSAHTSLSIRVEPGRYLVGDSGSDFNSSICLGSRATMGIFGCR